MASRGQTQRPDQHPLLDAPPDVHLLIAGQLGTRDRLDLGQVCRTLRRACPIWLRDVVLTIHHPPDTDADAAWLARYLAERGATLRYFPFDPYADEPEVGVSLAWMAARRTPLVYLDLGCMEKMREVPAAVGQFTDLTSLGLSETTAASGWGFLSRLAQLRELRADDCGITEVPPALATLSRLTKLDLSDNAIRGGWHILARLPQLRWLDLQGEVADPLPAEVACLTALTLLRVCAERDWRSLAALYQLQDLSIAACDEPEVPEEVSHLVTLTRLCLGPYMGGGWHRLEGLPQLRELDLHGNDVLEVLPAELSRLPALTKLDLTETGLARRGHLSTLTRLRELCLSDCWLREPPVALARLTALTRLDLSFNDLSGGWERLATLVQLRELSLCACQLEAPPVGLARLTALTRLDLSSNRLSGGWERLAGLVQLRELDAKGVPEELARLVPPRPCL